ncbi:tripartite tricarboxylate transporter permease [Inquilinus sp. CAU 1745]|uniref:tripartite tricarboxylate transporter permease n=1 Tax=Inquilinus sp. CAU 1745 TaxID=3140369 RepID=UPI00325BC365
MSVYADALSLLLHFDVILAIAAGTFFGLIMGSLPGLTATMAIALLIPVSFGMGSIAGIGMMLGALCGAMSGGAVSAILLNIPGTPSAVATTLDGFPMARNGEAGKALGISISSSFIGGIAGAILLILLAPPIAAFALRFGPAEFFSLGIFGLVIIASVSSRSLLKGLVAGIIGLFVSTIGADPMTGILRFTMDQPSLLSGVGLLPALIGLFAISQVFQDISEKTIDSQPVQAKQDVSSTQPHWRLVFGSWRALWSSTFIGAIIGAIPGAGGSIASFLSYDQAKRLSKTPEKFGTGHHEGLIASEASNNSIIGGALIPTLTLGVPGEAATAVLMGGLVIHGVRPGPALFDQQPVIVYGIFFAFILANIFMILIQWFGIRVFVKILQIPDSYLMPIILVFCVIGVYAVSGNTFDLYVMLIFGVLGFFLSRYGFGTAPVILGMILGDLVESNLRRGMIVFDGDWTQFVTHPISLAFLLMATVFLIYTLIQSRSETEPKRQEEAQ